MQPRDVFYLNDDQFNKIVELLTPGYELALLYKAQATGNVQPDEPTAPAGGETGASGVMDPGPAIGAAHIDPVVPATADPSAQGSG